MTYPPQGSQPPHGRRPGQPLWQQPQPHGRTGQPPPGYRPQRYGPWRPQGYRPQYGPWQPPRGYLPPPGYRPQPCPYQGHHPGYDHLPPPPPNNTGAIVALVAGLSLVLVTGVILTIMAFGGGTAVAGDERLRFLPDRTQPADTTASTDATAPSETGQPLVVQPPEANQPAQDQQPPSGQVAKVGETVTVAGLKPEVQVAATLNRVIDNATPDNRFLRPKDGNRFVAVELSLKNVGQEVYTDSPIIGALLIDAEGRQHNAALAGVAEGVSFGGAVSVAVGDSRKGVVVFEVPAGARPAKLQFGVMFGQQKGEWQLG
ncbi:DUF4352 domain-containing protein [Streptosporangium lutulentum]|uniref:DUF4352 domain-containing protein n=1 Tax=Streptosporangium lutulentum TaxID=1461250 RepID=A0ABT9QS65_9ACTN|nr:DUF4352 domain-containing protein [Streptosporangium lutulentum]MDP9849595.1 hypothetical protein [Streptosporangium lutulentum]